MITAKNITKVYGKNDNRLVAIDNVSLNIPSGVSLAIVGKSGSGKSTLMHLLSGLDSVTSGVISIDGRKLNELKEKEVDSLRSKYIGFIFQSFFVEANQSCIDNVSVPLEISRTNRHKRIAAAKEALKSVGLSDKAEEKAANLSGGQKQRLAIARAIVNEPRIIFADEPTGNLDSATSKMVEKLLFKLNKKLGANLMIVTHDSDLADKCEVQVHIKDGRVTKIVDPDKKMKES